MNLKFGILKELTTISDRCVAFSPTLLKQLVSLYPQAKFIVESSATRVFTDDEYKTNGIEVRTTISDCDVFIGICPIPADQLIPNTTYLFALDLVENQLEKDKYQQLALEKKCTMYDYSSVIDTNSFQRTRGIVGAYNAFRAFGIKFELFKLPCVTTFLEQSSLITYLKRPVLPPLKITVVGTDKIASGVKVIMKAMKIKEVSKSDFLSKNYTQAVFTLIDNLDSNDLEPLTKVSDIIIADASINGKSVVLSQEILKANDSKLRVVADLNPDSYSSIACTLRQSTAEEPFYGYLPNENKEVEVFHSAAIVVVAVPSSGTEFPKEVSEDFGNQLMEQLMPAFFDQDTNGLLKKIQI
jgi:hypothetical protein